MSIKDNKIVKIIKISNKAFGSYKIAIITLSIFGFLNGLLEGIGISTLIPIFSFMVKGQRGATDIVSQTIEKFFIYLNISFSLKYLLVFTCSLFILKAIVLLFSSYISIKIVADYRRKTMIDLFRQTLKSKWEYLLKQKVGYLETILMREIDFSTSFLMTISAMILTITTLLMYVLVALNISIYITLSTLSSGVILFFIFKPLLYKVKILSQRVSTLRRQATHYVAENIIGMKTIKAMAVENKIGQMAASYFDELTGLSVKLSLLRDIPSYSIEPFSFVFICILFAFSYLKPSFSLAAFGVIVYLIYRIFSYIRSGQLHLHSILTYLPYLENLISFEERTVKNREEDRGGEVFEFNNSLAFRDVSFSYNREKIVLSGLNFIVKKGEMIGLVGPSGVGKTTIVDLLLRLLEPGKGGILLDGKDISKIDIKEWRQNIGYVSQDIFLMNDTIKNNIKFYNDSISDEDITKAVKMANIYDFIEEQPNKSKTLVGERGIELSAGQRQRIILARVLVKNPQILVLDEATSSLDNESEVLIQKAINGLRGKTTVIVIAHRLSTIINSDKLITLDKGKIVEQGLPQELLKNKESYFYKIYNIRK